MQTVSNGRMPIEDATLVLETAPDRQTTMKAIVQDHYGEANDVLRLEAIERPAIGEDEVLVHVHAAGVDRGVWHLMSGLPYVMRIVGSGFRAPRNPVLGRELAGVVEAVGRNVTRLQPGEAVFGIGEGTFAQYARAREDKLAPKPTNLTLEQAAAVAISGSTALQALRDHGHVQSDQEVLIIGASGGVGSYAVQLAKAFGARVTGVCSTSKIEMVHSIGADRVIDYTGYDFATGHQRYDLVLDIGGNTKLARLRHVLAPKGTLVLVGGEGGGRWLGIRRQVQAMLISPSVGQTLSSFINKENYEDLIELKELIESGKITPVIDRTYPLAEVPEAIRYMHDGHARGKVVITV